MTCDQIVEYTFMKVSMDDILCGNMESQWLELLMAADLPLSGVKMARFRRNENSSITEAPLEIPATTSGKLFVEGYPHSHFKVAVRWRSRRRISTFICVHLHYRARDRPVREPFVCLSFVQFS